MSEGLKLCPFCGGDAELFKSQKFHVSAKDVRCKSSSCGAHYTRFSISEWNTRRIPEDYVMVPAELTDAMRDAWDAHPFSEDIDEEMRGAYRAMIDAAQEVSDGQSDT